MKRFWAPLFALVLVACLGSAQAEELKAGDPAPAFTFADGEGNEITLDQFKGKQGVVVAWFPKAFTPG